MPNRSRVPGIPDPMAAIHTYLFPNLFGYRYFFPVVRYRCPE
ncbi:hypothetical protein HSR122_1861 [Halapricum desulfuricans]|uniref:Uncharacterized protein n=1 Tax=Halapricum desulfuricans TaxID=2841257 RepID=A0A897N981_9EURY|nr:hypothetical protein HSR122_1861 [Halapricum desulfuricans]